MSAITQGSAAGLSYLAREGGAGTPVVLLHGIGSNAQSFVPLMRGARSALLGACLGRAGLRRLRRRSRSEWPDASDYAAALNRLLFDLDISRCILVGHSLGALIAARLALVSPNRVATLALVFAGARLWRRANRRRCRRRWRDRIDELDRLGAEQFAASAGAGPARRSGGAARRAAGGRASAMAAVRRPGYDQAARMLASGRLLEDAAKIAVPTAVLVGIAGSHHAARQRAPRVRGAAARRCGAPIAKFAGAGHALCQEQPAEVARAICSILDDKAQPMPEKTQDATRASASGAYIAPPVQRAVRLIRHVAEGNPVLNMSETAKALKINRTTLLRLLHTLEVEGFVERRPSGAGYQVGLSFLELGARALFSQDLVQVAVPVLTGWPRRLSSRPISACSTAPTCSISCAARPTRRSPATSGSAAGCPRMPPPWAA